MSPSLQLLSYLSEIPTVRLIVVCVDSWLMFAIKCSFTKQVHNAFFVCIQVVGGIDDQIPSLPSSDGVQIISYTKLFSQVI